MSIIATCFADVPDPRTGNAVRHEFLEVLTIALTACTERPRVIAESW
jgi:hypothetical protein